MNWNDLKNLWGRQPLPEWRAPDLAALEREFATKHRKLARALFWRDMSEAGAGVLVAAGFGWVGWLMGRAGWPIIFAVLPILGLSGFFVRERLRVHRQQPAPDAALLVRLEVEIAEQRRQHWLLSHVAVWYLGPCLLGGAIFGATVLLNAPTPVTAKLAAAAVMAAVMTLIGWFVVWLNRRAVRQVIEPRLQELEQWRQALIFSS